MRTVADVVKHADFAIDADDVDHTVELLTEKGFMFDVDFTVLYVGPFIPVGIRAMNMQTMRAVVNL